MKRAFRRSYAAARMLGIAALLCGGAEARAGDIALADAKFDEGKRLMREGRVTEACAAFEASQQEDPAGGTLLHLGLCRSAEGRTATASEVLREALLQAETDGREDRAIVAREQLEKLESQLSKLIIVVNAEAANVPLLRVERDDTLVDPARWGAPVAVDPGPHTIRATAEGKRPWEQRIEIRGSVPVTLVAIPVLDDVRAPLRPIPPPVAPVERPQPEPSPGTSPQARIGVGTLVALGAVESTDAGGLDASFSGGLTAMAGVRWPRWSLAIEGRFELPRTEETSPGVELSTSRALMTFAPCTHTGIFLACVTGSIGAFTAERTGREPSSETKILGGGGPRIGVEVPFNTRISGRLIADLAIDTPVTVRSEGRDAWRSSPVSGSIGLGVIGGL